MKFYFTFLAALFAGSSLSAQAKLDLVSRNFMNEKSELSEPSRLRSANAVNGDYQGVIIRLEEGQTLEELQDAGIDVSFVIADKFIVTNVTREQMAKLDLMQSVKSVNASTKKFMKNKKVSKTNVFDTFVAKYLYKYFTIKKLYCKLFDYIPYIDIALQYGIELLLLLLIKLYK